MAIVRPFKGIRFNPEKVLLKQVIAPPYDVISPEYRQVLAHRSASNIVHIDLPEGGDDRYDNAAVIYNEWCEEGILIRDTLPTIYIYEQEYDYNGRHFTRTGFIALLKLEELGKGVVFPHEKTLSGPKKDRFDLMTACKANFSSIFGLYLDPEDRVKTIANEYKQGMPMESAVDDDKVKHSVWKLTDKDAIQDIQKFMKDKAIYIADGHHRYETALLYRDTMREKNNDHEDEVKPYDYVMMTFVNFFDSGLLILPTHRVVSVPADFDENDFIKNMTDFNITPLSGPEATEEFLQSHDEPGTMVMLTANGTYGLLLDQDLLESLHPVYRNVDTYLLQKNILEKNLGMSEEQILAKKGIYFYQTQQEILNHIAKNGGIGFVLKGVTIDAMRQVSESGLVMPQKSTYFYPKLITGLVLNELE